MLLAAFTKSAQFPFHFWLPNAMQAPTPVSAYLHSATMVKAGVYLVARMTPLLGGTVLWTGTVTVVGAVTMIGGAYRAVLETDLKRVLAYSTISALGVLMLLFGIGTPEAVIAGLAYLLAHACYKGALFLVAGAVEHETGTRDVTAARRASPRRCRSRRSPRHWPPDRWRACRCSSGSSPRSSSTRASGRSSCPACGAGFSSRQPSPRVQCLGAAGLIAGVAPFGGRPAASPATHEAPAIALAGTTGARRRRDWSSGSFPRLVDIPLGLAAAVGHGNASAGELRVLARLQRDAVAQCRDAAGSLALFAYRDVAFGDTPGRARSARNGCTQVRSTARGISDAVAPALQSASLRSYVLTVIVTAVALVGTALAIGRILPALSRWTPIELHEGASRR